MDKNKLRIVRYPFPVYALPAKRKPSKKFKFLYVANLRRSKNVDGLISAFDSEFCDADDVELRLHITSLDSKNLALFVEKYRGMPRVNISHDKIEYDKVIELIGSADFYISVDKANGWGVPCTEAMMEGVPAGAVDWGGSKEFMNKSNSFLIRPNGLEPVDYLGALEVPLYIGHKWAHVENSEIRRVLRLAYSDKEMRERLSENAAAYLKQNFSFQAIGAEMLENFAEAPLRSCSGNPVFSKKSMSSWMLYLLSEDIRDNLGYLITYCRPDLLICTFMKYLSVFKSLVKGKEVIGL